MVYIYINAYVASFLSLYATAEAEVDQWEKNAFLSFLLLSCL